MSIRIAATLRHVDDGPVLDGLAGGDRVQHAGDLHVLGKVRHGALRHAAERPNIRDEIWVKLWGNVSLNPISALTLATLDVLCGDAGTRAAARAMMVEAQAIAEKLGVKFPIDVDRRPVRAFQNWWS